MAALALDPSWASDLASDVWPRDGAPAHRIFVAGAASHAGKSTVCLGLLSALAERWGAGSVAYIKPATQDERLDGVARWCDARGVARVAGADCPLVYYAGFTRASACESTIQPDLHARVVEYVTRVLRPCFESSMRVIDSSENQPNRLRSVTELVRPRRPGSPVDCHAGGTRLVAAVKPPPRAAVDAMLAATGSAELSRDQFQAMMRTLARDGASRLAATVSVALVRPRVESKSSTRLQCARMRMF